MSGKREAQYQIDQKTLQDKQPISKPSESEPKQKPEVERKIVEIKRESENNQQKKELLSKPEIVDQKQQKEQKNQEKVNLFSNLFKKASQSNGTGLFASSNSSIFSNTSNLFSTTNSIFSNNTSNKIESSLSTGLFSKSQNKNKQEEKSIFNFQTKGVPPIKSGGHSLFSQENNDNEQSGDSAQLQQAQKLQSDPTKSTSTYKYKEECELIKKIKAHKFKRNSGDLIEWVDLYIQKDNQSNLVYIIAKLPATQKVIFSGLLLQKKSQIRHLNNKDQNVQISCFNLNQKDQKTLQRNILKIQFQKAETGKQLYQCVKQIITQKISQKDKSEQNLNQNQKS